MKRFSVIIPVYNRPDEVDELLDSLARQSRSDFEVVIVEDGSTVPCREVVDRYVGRLDLKYIYKENEGGRLPAMSVSRLRQESIWCSLTRTV